MADQIAYPSNSGFFIFFKWVSGFGADQLKKGIKALEPTLM